MSSFFYKYIMVRSFTKGKKTLLYFSRFIFQLYRSLPILLRLAIVSFRFFNLLYRSCQSLIHFRFWLLTLNHFVVIYQAIFLLRILTEYFYINQHQSNKFIKTIFYLSEPYFKVSQALVVKLLPENFLVLGNIFAFQAIGIIAYYIQKLSRIILCYENNSRDLREVNLLLDAVFDEKLVFI